MKGYRQGKHILKGKVGRHWNDPDTGRFPRIKIFYPKGTQRPLWNIDSDPCHPSRHDPLSGAVAIQYLDIVGALEFRRIGYIDMAQASTHVRYGL